MAPPAPLLVIISANAEWRAVCPLFTGVRLRNSPYGEWFSCTIAGRKVIYFHGGWGKIAAAASAEYAIDRWKPALLVNLGTCGGIRGRVEPGTVLLVEETLVYDILEQMGDPGEALDFYSTRLDLGWLPQQLPLEVRRARLVSADRDIVKEEIPHLVQEYGAIAADWESGAIAWVCARRGLRCLVLRGVTDLVSAQGGEAYGNFALFEQRTREMMQKLVESLPGFI